MKSNINPDIKTVLVLFLVISIFIGSGIWLLGPQLHVPLLFSIAFLIFMKMRYGYTWKEIEGDLLLGIQKIYKVVLLFIVIGMLMGIWVSSGCVPSIVYFGLTLISPKIFLVMTFIIMSLISYSMGTAMGATATVGVALMMVGVAQGMPEPLCAGAIVSGAFFGDRSSPISGTMNLTAVATETSINDLVRDLIKGILPAWLISALIYFVIGNSYYQDASVTLLVNNFTALLTQSINISVILLIPPLLLIVLAYKRIPMLINVFINIIVSTILGLIYQTSSLKEIVMTMYRGYHCDTNNAFLDALLNRGGIVAIQDIVILCIIVACLAGLLEGGNFIEALINMFQTTAKKFTFFASMFISVVGNIISGSQLFAIVSTSTIFNPVVGGNEKNRRILARSIADAGTIMAPLIPWNLNGVFMKGLLGVSALSYGPYALLCWITPILTIIWYIFRSGNIIPEHYKRTE